MRCEEIQTRLQEYLDGALSPGQAQAVEVHLARCAACREELTLLRQVDEALAAWPALAEPADFTAQVMAQVSAMERGRGSSPELRPVFRLGWADAAMSLAFAGAVTAVLAGSLWLRPQHVLTAGALLQRAWWTLLPELDRLWHTAQVEPVYALWAFSTLCVATAAAVSAVALVRQWQRRPVAAAQQ